MSKETYVLFQDPAGRVVFGAEGNTGSTKTLNVKNPVIVHYAPTGDPSDPQQKSKLSVQLFPVVFRELLNDPYQPVVWSYPKDKIVMSDIKSLNTNLVTKYDAMFTQAPQGEPQPAEQTQFTPPINKNTDEKVVNLFDDHEEK